MPKFRDMTGQVFGRLTAVERAPNRGRRTMWRCQCGCGRTTEVVQDHLAAGRIRSCGCLRDEVAGARLRRHGAKGTPEYLAWKNMRARCLYPGSNSYKNYGGRGIRVCERWALFENFRADMGPRPSPRHSLERIENGGHYEPGNVKWATRAEQARNTRRNVLVSYRGQTHTLVEWARALGLPAARIRDRLAAGWGVERALETPGRNTRGKPTAQEVQCILTLRAQGLTSAAIAAEVGVSRSAVRRLIAKQGVPRLLQQAPLKP